jgi:long-chain acyl-CoA synthetase
MHTWFVWPEQDFPRTSTQKPRRNLIREVVLAQLDRKKSTAGASPLSELIERVTGRRAGNMNAQSNLETDLNLSSLDRVALLSALEDRYQIDLSEIRFASVNTVGDLERMLHGEKPARVEYHYPAWVLRWPVTWIRLLAHYLLLRPSVLLLGWPRMEGREKLHNIDGPALVICNHIGDVDVGFVHTALPGRLGHKLATATGGEALEILRTPPKTRNWIGRVYDRFKWILGVSLLNLFPLPREAGFRQSFAYAGECVDRGYSVLVFPEGHHTVDGKLHPFRAGIGLLANNLNVPIVPMRIDGLFELKQAGKKFAKPHQVTVKIGVPVRFPRNSDPEWIARQLESAVEKL